MSYVGQMVRAGGSAPMKVVDISNDIAECVWIDGNGVIRRRFHEIDHLTPFWMSLGPKSLWPDMSQIDLIEIEREERAAAAQRKAQRDAAKKAKKSNKLKRKVSA